MQLQGIWRRTAAIGLTVLLVACGSPRLDTSSAEALKSSMEDVRSSLGDAERKEFDEYVGKNLPLVVMMGGLTGVTPQQVFEPMNGMTGTEMIAFAKKRKEESDAKKREKNEAKLAEFEKRIADRAAELELLKKITIDKPRIVESNHRFMREVDLVATVTNGLDVPLKWVGFRHELKSQDRSVPWNEDDDAFFSAEGGLEPGETKEAKAIGRFGYSLLMKQMGEHPEAVLSVSVIDATKPDDTRIPSVPELSDYEKRDYEKLKKELGR